MPKLTTKPEALRPSRPLPKQRYAELLRDVQDLVVTANAAVDQRKVTANWNLGRRIARERLADQSGYHNSVLRDLCADTRIAQEQQRSSTTTNTTNSLLPRPTDSSYLYRAKVDQIVDGDTLDLSIDLGFHTDRRGRFRLAAVDAPEIDTKQGRPARDFVYQRLLNAKTIVVKTLRTDLHGRYVTHLFYSDEDLTIDQCFTQGVHLNNELVEQGHAELV